MKKDRLITICIFIIIFTALILVLVFLNSLRPSRTSNDITGVWGTEVLGEEDPLRITKKYRNFKHTYTVDWYTEAPAVESDDRPFHISGTIKSMGENFFSGKVDVLSGTMKQAVQKKIYMTYNKEHNTLSFSVEGYMLPNMVFTPLP